MCIKKTTPTKSKAENLSAKGQGPPVHIESIGPWPFISRHTLVTTDGERIVLRSRHHRKGLQRATNSVELLRCLWMPEQLNWWIGIIFSLGALLFALGSALVLAPATAHAWSIDANAVNRIFFAGSIPFTTAAYLQLFQAANAGDFTAQKRSGPGDTSLFGWKPHEIGWLSCALQFVGTLLFNINTFDAMLPGLNWLRQDLTIWIPDFFGSILFLVSGYLAFIETCHTYWAWKPGNLSWWLTFINFIGCVAFMISAVFAFVPSHSPTFDAATISVLCTLIGAACFLFGSLLMLPEATKVKDSETLWNT
jgi:hypothetical protein